MLHIKETIIVEGKFDKEKLKKITDAAIICTEGFNLYRDGRIISSIKKMAEKTGINFFHNLPNIVEAPVEQQCSPSAWGIQ